MVQLAFKQAKCYFRFQNDRAKGRMGSSLQSLEKDLTFFTSVVYNTKSQNSKQYIFVNRLKVSINWCEIVCSDMIGI